VLVAAALLLARSFARLLDVDAGINPAHVLTLRTSLPRATYADSAAMVKAHVDVARRLRESPGVEAAGAVTGLPLASTRGTVVGIVADVRHRGLDVLPRPEMYRPHTQFRYSGSFAPAVSTMTWVVRTVADPRATTSYARAAIQAVDPNLGMSDVATMDQVLADSTSDRRLNMLLFTVLGSLALALATIGVYGVVAYAVTQRTHAIGVRMAIGAKPSDVVRMMPKEGGRLAIAGVAAGSVLALAGARLIRGLLFEVSATDPLTFAAVAVGLLGVALTASYIPARRATRVDPMIALRGEP
jgi:putative ABC transport system permease protein